MSDHSVEWDKGADRLRLICTAKPDARCQWEPTCNCEHYTGLKQAPDGSWSHYAYDELFGGEGKHQHSRKATECHYMMWWYEYDMGREAGPPESFWMYDDNDDPIPPPEGPVTFDWNGDSYEWKYARSAT